MRRIAATLVLLLLTASLLGSTAPPAHADPLALDFTCGLYLPSWPGTGSANCPGQATGVAVLGGRVVVCEPSCDFFAAIHSYGAICVASEPPLVGFYTGEIFIDGYNVGQFSWEQAAMNFAFVPPGTLRGHGMFIPGVLPQPTCAAPSATSFVVTGEMGSN